MPRTAHSSDDRRFHDRLHQSASNQRPRPAAPFLENDPTLAKLGEWSGDAANSTVLFLGDNIYNEGLVDDDRERGEMILAQQLAATGAHKILIPGNHDWGLFKMRESSIQNHQAFVAAWRDGEAARLGRAVPRNYFELLSMLSSARTRINSRSEKCRDRISSINLDASSVGRSASC